TYASPESFNSQLGVALSLLKIKHSHKVAIIEAGVSQPGEMQHHIDMINPDHVIVTNIGLAHIASLGSQEAIIKEKMKLVAHVPDTNWCLLPKDKSITPHLRAGKYHYFWNQEYPELPEVKHCEAGERASLRYQLRFPNERHHHGTIEEGLSYVLDLITIGVKAAHLIGVSEDQIINALSKYRPEPMRIELWKTQQGITLINDTYCSDPMSCDIALKQFESLGEKSNQKIFLFGGLRDISEHPETDMARVAHAVEKNKITLCITYQNEHQKELISSLALVSPQTEIITAFTEKAAIAIAKIKAKPSDVLLIKGAQKHSISELIQEFDESLPNNQVIINLAAIGSNIETIRAHIPKGTRIMMMVKALAYGTDDVRIAKFLHTAGIDILGVSYVDEGVSMRTAGVVQDIFVLNAAEYEASKAVKWGLEIGVSEKTLIKALQKEAARQEKKIKVHLHVDTGMSRFGCRPADLLELAETILSSPNLIFEGIMTHFACADNPNEDSFTLHQAKILEQAIEMLAAKDIHPKWRHAANSSATCRFRFPAFNMIRIGLAAYGFHTSASKITPLPLQPSISLTSRIVGINCCTPGDTISYGRSHTIQKVGSRVAVLPIGYFDGLHRNYSGKSAVMIRGKLAPMCGRICMDYMMCDITDIPQAAIGDPVLIFGEDENGNYVSPEELASAGSSIVHELLTCLGPRIRRLFIYDESLRPR
ncbi:MAG: alr, partial [Chlamydiia bacterium]|nr:alr [Chlamydiia bacterium]